MASAADTGSGNKRVGARTRSRSNPLVDEEIVPNSGWTEDSRGHCLLVDLPGFKKEEVKLEFDDSGHVIVRGERLTNEQKRLHFELIFPVPTDSDVDKIAGNFDSEILYVHVPKPSPQQEINKRSSEREEEISNDNMGGVERPGEIIESNVEHINSDNEGKNENARHVEDFPREVMMRKWEQRETGMSRSNAVEVLMRNKGIVVTAVIAFSLGMYVSHKFQSLTVP